MDRRMIDASPLPTESQEQTCLFRWAQMQQGYYPELRLLYHIPNGGSRHRMEAIHLKQQGVRAGVPDICLPVARSGCHSLYIEMKRLKGGRVSPEQLGWMEALKAEGHMVAVCQGWGMASEIILAYLKGSGADYIRYEIRLMLSMHRKLPRIRVMELSLDAPVMDGEEPTLGDAVAADVDIEAGADRQEITQAVNEAVDRLPEKQRDLVRLCDLQGRSLSDAARVCDTSLPSAQNTHKTALKTLFFDENLRALAIAHELDEWTDWHHHVGATNYRSTWVSSTEALVFDRENRRRMLMKKYTMSGPLSGAEKHF